MMVFASWEANELLPASSERAVDRTGVSASFCCVETRFSCALVLHRPLPTTTTLFMQVVDAEVMGSP
jgi:hypothetical protein